MNVAILGSGFGLYGYLAALQALPCRVLIPERYRRIVESREELSSFAAGIAWVADESVAIDLADAIFFVFDSHQLLRPAKPDGGQPMRALLCQTEPHPA